MPWDTSLRVQIIRNSNDLRDLSRQVKGGAQRGVNASAERIRKRAYDRAKVDTGYMRESVHVTGANLAGDAIGAQVVSPAFYSGFLDMGTRYIAADRWFTGAVRLEEREYGDTIRRYLFGAGEGKT